MTGISESSVESGAYMMEKGSRVGESERQHHEVLNTEVQVTGRAQAK